MTNNEQRFQNFFNAVNETLEKTVRFYSYSKYCRKVDYLKNVKLKEYIAFIDNLYISNNYALISCINKLIDKSGFSIFSLVKFVKKYPCLFGKKKEDSINTIQEVEEELHQYNTLIKNLKTHRDKFHAHLCEDVAGSDNIYYIFNEIQVKEEDLDGFIKCICKCIQDINFIFNETYENVYIRNLVENEDFLYELNDVKKVFELLETKTTL